jgi:hypothetical protein
MGDRRQGRFRSCCRQERAVRSIFTVHSGNYDIGAGALRAQIWPRHPHRAHARSLGVACSNCARKSCARRKRREPNLHIHYNEPGGHLGMELCRKLLAGEVVCVQGDRVMGDVAPRRPASTA